MKVQYGHGYLQTLRIDTVFVNGLLLVAERPRWRVVWDDEDFS